MSKRFAYPGRELEAMATASNYHRWILRLFEPYLGAHLIEVGAGIGSFSELILAQHACQTLALVEPSAEMHRQLAAHARQLAATAATRVETYNAVFAEAAPRIAERQRPDSVLYVNVLEHIGDDEGELRAVYRTLSGGGRILIFVPALPQLYGTFDARIGHIRRYTRRDLEEKLKRAGFEIVKSVYFDFLGIAPWWVKYRLLKSDTMERGAVQFYDRFIVPAARRLESLFPPPVGKNLVVVAQKGQL